MRQALRRVRSQLSRVPAAFEILLHPFRSSRRLADLTAETGQLRAALQESGGLIPPPAHLQRRVNGDYVPNFLEGGQSVVADIERVLARAQLRLNQFHRILDFGCGCGRVTRYLRARMDEHAKYFATDIDGEAIDWCRRHYSSIAEFQTNPSLPPTAFPDGFFDFVFSISILTHLPEDLQHAWLKELVRISRPGAYVLQTIHGPKHVDKIPRRFRDNFDRIGFAYAQGTGTEGLPDFYQTAFHSHDYVRREWSRYLDIIDIVPLAISNHQDAVLCRTRL